MAQTKREKAIKAAVVPGKAYAFEDAINILKSATKAKFVESIDVAVRLGVDAKKSDQQVRGSTVLPAGTGKSVRVAVFARPVPRLKKPGRWRRSRRHGRPGREDAGRRSELRRRHRHPGRHARRRQAGQCWPARPDAEPEGRHRFPEPVKP
jgi:hypothetical protein